MTTKSAPRGSRTKAVTLGYKVEESSKELFDAVAKRVGFSGAVFFDLLMEHLSEELDPITGLPSWWKKDLDRDGELPIDSA